MGSQSLKDSGNFSHLPGFLSCLLLAGLLITGSALSGTDESPSTMQALKRAVQQELDNRVRVLTDTPVVLPGVTAAVMLPGGQFAAFAAGLSDLDHGVAMQVDTRMPAGSVGKMFVAAVAMSLVSEGWFKLDEPVARWLGKEPWFSRLPNHQTLTLRHLLNHSGGIIDHVFDEGSDFHDWFVKRVDKTQTINVANKSERDATDRAFDPATLVQFVLDREPLFAAGEDFHCTDTGYILIGLAIEKATDSTYYEQLTKRFHEPLGLTLTTPQDNRYLANLAQGYAVESRTIFGLPHKVLVNGRLVFNPLIEWTGGGIVSNPKNWCDGRQLCLQQGP